MAAFFISELAESLFPNLYLHFEDFGRGNAANILNKEAHAADRSESVAAISSMRSRNFCEPSSASAAGSSRAASNPRTARSRGGSSSGFCLHYIIPSLRLLFTGSKFSLQAVIPFSKLYTFIPFLFNKLLTFFDLSPILHTNSTEFSFENGVPLSTKSSKKISVILIAFAMCPFL